MELSEYWNYESPEIMGKREIEIKIDYFTKLKNKPELKSWKEVDNIIKSLQEMLKDIDNPDRNPYLIMNQGIYKANIKRLNESGKLYPTDVENYYKEVEEAEKKSQTIQDEDSKVKVEETDIKESSIEENSIEENSIEENSIEESSIEESSIEENSIKEINIEKINRKLGYLSTKYPESGEIPRNIEREKELLFHMRYILGNSAKEFEIAKDGTKVPKRLLRSAIPGQENKKLVDYYNETLEQYNELHERNIQAKLISQEEQNSYQFPKLDIDALREEMRKIRSKEELMAFYRGKVASRHDMYYSNEDMKKLREFGEELWSNPYIKRLPETVRKEVAQTVSPSKEETAQTVSHGKKEVTQTMCPGKKEDKPVDISKFSQIYQKAKGRIKTAFEHIKSFMSRNKEQPVHSKDDDKTIND